MITRVPVGGSRRHDGPGEMSVSGQEKWDEHSHGQQGQQSRAGRDGDRGYPWNPRGNCLTVPGLQPVRPPFFRAERRRLFGCLRKQQQVNADTERM